MTTTPIDDMLDAIIERIKAAMLTDESQGLVDLHILALVIKDTRWRALGVPGVPDTRPPEEEQDPHKMPSVADVASDLRCAAAQWERAAARTQRVWLSSLTEEERELIRVTLRKGRKAVMRAGESIK